MRTFLSLALAAGFCASAAAGDGATAARRDTPLLRVEGRLGDVLHHPAFAGFAPLILPWDERAYDEAMPLGEIAALLPYHREVRPAVVVAALNRLADDALAGATVFYRFYSADETAADPSKANTGLFFLRGRPGAPFAVIAPGGGFAYVGAVHEGFPYAVEINRRGFNAFVLRYRAGLGQETATRDLAAALGFIFRNAEALGVAREGYSLWGSSAGARMAASIGSHGAAAFGGDASPKPAAVVMAYTAHSDHAAQEPPTFVVVGAQDSIAPPAAMLRRVEALRRTGATVSSRVYEGVGHGFGSGAGTSAQGWIDDAVTFWSRFAPTP